MSEEQRVRQAFSRHPILIEIARCESGFRQFDEHGRVLKNPNSSAIGVMQIMASYHTEAATELGYDLRTTEGNLGYALELYQTQGSHPWNASSHCWG